MRTHDVFYLDETYKKNPKESSKFILEEIKKDFSVNEKTAFSILDIGCETGSFLEFVGCNCLNAQLYGIDVMPE